MKVNRMRVHNEIKKNKKVLKKKTPIKERWIMLRIKIIKICKR